MGLDFDVDAELTRVRTAMQECYAASEYSTRTRTVKRDLRALMEREKMLMRMKASDGAGGTSLVGFVPAR